MRITSVCYTVELSWVPTDGVSTVVCYLVRSALARCTVEYCWVPAHGTAVQLCANWWWVLRAAHPNSPQHRGQGYTSSYAKPIVKSKLCFIAHSGPYRWLVIGDSWWWWCLKWWQWVRSGSFLAPLSRPHLKEAQLIHKLGVADEDFALQIGFVFFCYCNFVFVLLYFVFLYFWHFEFVIECGWWRLCTPNSICTLHFYIFSFHISVFFGIFSTPYLICILYFQTLIIIALK